MVLEDSRAPWFSPSSFLIGEVAMRSAAEGGRARRWVTNHALNMATRQGRLPSTRIRSANHPTLAQCIEHLLNGRIVTVIEADGQRTPEI